MLVLLVSIAPQGKLRAGEGSWDVWWSVPSAESAEPTTATAALRTLNGKLIFGGEINASSLLFVGGCFGFSVMVRIEAWELQSSKMAGGGLCGEKKRGR